MTVANFDALHDYLKGRYDIDETSVRAAAEGVWYADRHPRGGMGTLNVKNGIWWTNDGSHIVSLAHGTDLHAFHTYDWEIMQFRGEPNFEDDVCCHGMFDQAEACALGWIRTGRYCGG